MFKHIILAFVMLVSGLTAQADIRGAAAQITSAESLIEDAAESLKQSDEDEIADVLLSYVETDAIARFTLGNHAKRLSESALRRYTTAFEAWLQTQVENHSHRIGAVGLTVADVDYRNRNDAIVTTAVRQQGETVRLRWRVIRRDGKWGVVDLQFAGVWLAIEQRAQVDAILDRPGADIDEVIARMS